MNARSPKLTKPPVNEVVCGFVFDTIPEITPAQHGAYWVQRRADFPKHEIHPPLVDQTSEGVEFIVGPPLMRTWLVSSDETRLIQLQNDRLFMNWRRRRESDAYPRFHDHDGETGLLTFALAEFARFATFVEGVARRPNVQKVELTKIDVFEKGKHWRDFSDLRALLPWLASSIDLLTAEKGNLLLRLEEKEGSGTTTRVMVANGLDRETQIPVIRLETTARGACAIGEVEKTFKAMNRVLNDLFFRLVPAPQLQRFGIEGSND